MTSLCGTDALMGANEMGQARAIIGHEGVGRIETLGSNVTVLDPTVEVGQRVGVAYSRDFCGACGFCKETAKDGEIRCTAKPWSGTAFDGTFAQYTIVPARYLLRIPDDRFGDLPDEMIAPMLCGGVTAYTAVKTCDGLVPGQWIAVCGGGGGVGAFAVAFGKAMGYRVIATDTGAEKGEHALAGGAEHYIDITSPEVNATGVAEEVKKLTNGLGVSAAIVCTGVAAAYQSALGMLAPFGTLMCVGIPHAEGLIAFHPFLCIALGFKIMGTAVGSRRDTLEALEFVKRGLVKPKVQWGELESLTELMEEVKGGKVSRSIFHTKKKEKKKQSPADTARKQVLGKYVINLDKV